jgi:orotidine-5'-phosphate decarboxylase
MKALLSAKPIPVRERLIVALDVASGKLAKKLVNELGDSVFFYKVGLELLMSGDFFDLVQWLRERDKQVFADIKFFDVPETVKKAAAQVKRLGVAFVTAHGNDDILKAVVEVKGDTKVLAVTVLTSLDKNDLRDLGFACDIEALVLSRARRALALGCDGVISSGLEVSKLRQTLGAQFLIVTPGIRAFSTSATTKNGPSQPKKHSCSAPITSWWDDRSPRATNRDRRRSRCRKQFGGFSIKRELEFRRK